jgi:hypothetical protein
MLRLNTPTNGEAVFAIDTLDFNNIMDQGTYSAFGVTTTNGPLSNVQKDFTMAVSIASSGDITQTVYSPAGPYKRTKSGGSWSSWVRSDAGIAKHAVLTGATSGDVTLTGIGTLDELDEVLYFAGAGTSVTDVTDLTSEFTITATNTINNAGGTSSTGGKLVVRYTKLS